MRVIFSNPPWWQGICPILGPHGQPMNAHVGGVRAGSRWPHTGPKWRSPDNFVFGGYMPYPFFMGYAATYAQAKTGAEVVMRDSIALSESYQSYIHYLDENRFDLMFIESATPSWEHDSHLIRILKARYPHMRIAVAGPIGYLGPKMMEDYPVDACIRGEYEKGAVRVIQGESGYIDFDLLTRQEMNAAPFPYYDAVIAHRYLDTSPVGQVFPHAQVWSSRGCPYKCIFCVWPATMTGNDPDGSGKRSVRHYTAEYMEAFLAELVGRYGFKSIYFDDDTFNLGDAHVEAMCGVMSKLGLPWSAMCRADTIKRDTWRLMKESGCFGVKLGFESGNQYVVDKIVNKRLDLEKAREVVLFLKNELGMTLHGTFTIGLPGESEAQMGDTRSFIASLPFDTHQLSGCAEIEGTPLHTLSQRGELARYEGARMSDDYVRISDGAIKAARLSSRLAAQECAEGEG